MYTRAADRVPQSAAQEFRSFSVVYVQIHEQIWETRIARISGRSCRDRLTRSTRYHRDSGSVLTLVRLAILDPCRQVCNASFTFLGLLTGRWHTLRCSGALGHVWSKCRLAKLVNLCTVYYTRAADRVASPPRRNFPHLRRCACKSMSRPKAGRLDSMYGEDFRAVMSRQTYAVYSDSTRYHRDIG